MTPLEQIIIQELPTGIALIKEAFVKKNPDAPVPTSEEVIAAYESGFISSVAKDDRIISENTQEP